MAFSDVYTALRTRTDEYFSTVLTGDRRRKEMNDPYDPESGKTDDLNSSWGYKIGSEDTNDTLNNALIPNRAYNRSFELLLSNKYVNGRGKADKRVEEEIILIEDGKNLVQWLQDKFISCPYIDSISLQSDNGIEFIFNDRFISINFNLLIKYQE